MSDVEKQADAEALEKAIRVLERRFGEVDPVPAMRAYLFNMVLGLRSELDHAPGKYCCLRPDCTHERDQVFNGGGGE